MGYPTANLHVRRAGKIVPASGVYVVEVLVGAVRGGGITNIGVRPTVTGGTGETIEVHIFDTAPISTARRCAWGSSGACAMNGSSRGSTSL